MSGLVNKADQARSLVNGDIRSLLRRATQRDHNRLHSSSLLGPLILPSITLTQYQTAMIAMLHTYTQVDEWLLRSPWLDHTSSFRGATPYHARSTGIQSDLHALGIEPGAIISQPANALNLPADLPTYLGIRYVVEGSQFGNCIIWRNLQAVFGSAADNMCTTWQPTGTADKDWTKVIAALSALETRREVAAAVRGARYMFRYFVTAYSGGN